MDSTEQTARAAAAPRRAAGAPRSDPFGLRGSILAAIAAAPESAEPYQHWAIRDLFTAEAQAALRALPKHPIDVKGVSGKRELHNDERHYFDAAAIAARPICRAVANVFQSAEIVAAFAAKTGARLEGTYLRLEQPHDTDGFWLQPHTDERVKMLTLLCALPAGPEQADLGTDLYASAGAWAKRAPFVEGAALMFVPTIDVTWHGFEKRPITGVRTSLIMNYVTAEWRDRWQLSFPDQPVTAG